MPSLLPWIDALPPNALTNLTLSRVIVRIIPVHGPVQLLCYTPAHMHKPLFTYEMSRACAMPRRKREGESGSRSELSVACLRKSDWIFYDIEGANKPLDLRMQGIALRISWSVRTNLAVFAAAKASSSAISQPATGCSLGILNRRHASHS